MDLDREIRAGRWKLIDAADPDARDMLFDLVADPQETVKLIGKPETRSRTTDLRRRLDRWWTPRLD